MYKIEKNIPIPSIIKEFVYPWSEMAVDDCFLVECDFEDSREVRRVRGRIYSSGNGWLEIKDFGDKLKIVLRRESKGIRVWLVSR